jgi:hypothetical protein
MISSLTSRITRPRGGPLSVVMQASERASRRAESDFHGDYIAFWSNTSLGFALFDPLDMNILTFVVFLTCQ